MMGPGRLRFTNTTYEIDMEPMGHFQRQEQDIASKHLYAGKFVFYLLKIIYGHICHFQNGTEMNHESYQHINLSYRHDNKKVTIIM